jgi:hypothetical protein
MITATFHEFKALFEALPVICAVLSPEFRFLAATDAYAVAAEKPKDEFIGKVIYEVFPDNPLNHGKGPKTIKASLERVMATGLPDSLGVIRYDVELPEGGFAERWWRPVHTPVIDNKGHIRFIIHLVEDMNNVMNVLMNAEQAAMARGMTRPLLNQFFQ